MECQKVMLYHLPIIAGDDNDIDADRLGRDDMVINNCIGVSQHVCWCNLKVL